MSITTTNTRQNKRGQYLPVGVRDELALIFNVSVKSIDKRLQNFHPETVAKCKEIVQSRNMARMQAEKDMKLLREGKL